MKPEIGLEDITVFQFHADMIIKFNLMKQKYGVSWQRQLSNAERGLLDMIASLSIPWNFEDPAHQNKLAAWYGI